MIVFINSKKGEGKAYSIRNATIQCVDVSIYCLWCITIQRYIVRYKVESKQWSMLFFNVDFCFFREINELNFLREALHTIQFNHNVQ